MISQILTGMQEGDGFPCQNDWFGYGQASQFWQMERALCITVVTKLLYVPGLQSIISLYLKQIEIFTFYRILVKKYSSQPIS